MGLKSLRFNCTPPFFVFFLALSLVLDAQTYSDGPINLQLRTRDVSITLNTPDDFTLDVGPFTPSSVEEDEWTVKVWGVGNQDVTGTGWQGGNCYLDEFNPPGLTVDFNDVFFNESYPGPNVPMYFDLKVDAWEDDAPADFDWFPSGITGVATNDCETQDGHTRCDFTGNTCCASWIFGCILNEDDDKRCDADPFATGLDYRQGPPCQWYDHGYITGNCPSNNYYRPRIESFWRYEAGTACNNTIDLGTLSAGGTITHFNSNECYSNNFPNSPGNDVFYSFTITNAMGVEISLCGSSGAQFDSELYLLDASCNIDTMDSDGCGSQSIITKTLCVPGTYIVVVDAAAAIETGTFTLTITEDPNFTFAVNTNATDVSCAGLTDGTITTSVNGGVSPYTYSWDFGPSTPDVTGLGAGIYTVTVTDDDGCTATATDTIIDPLPLNLTPASTDVTCGGATDGTASVVVSGGTAPYNYIWNSIPPQTASTAVLLPAGNYTVTVTDDNGCVGTASSTVGTATIMTVTLDNLSDISCFGADDGTIDISVAGGDPPYTYNWSNSAVTEDVSGLAPGPYDITIFDSMNCQVSANYVINEPPLLTSNINFTIDVECFGGDDGSADLSVAGGTPPYSFAWTGGIITEDLLDVPAGGYDVTVTDANGCTSMNTVTIDEPTEITTSVTGVDVPCFGGTGGSADLTVGGGTAPYTFLWSNFEITEDATSLDPGTYLVVITDDNGCTSFDSVTISEPAELEATVATTSPSCDGSTDATADVTVTGGTTPYVYNWSSGSSGPSISNAGAGTYDVDITDDNGCMTSISFTIDEPAALNVNIEGVDVTCIGFENGVAAADVTGGTEPYSYQWDTDPVQTNYIVEDLPIGTYTVTIVDDNGCAGSAVVTIAEPLEDPEECFDPASLGVGIPNAFSPNNDGVNDVFTVMTFNGTEITGFSIYDRWGKQVFHTSNATVGWDGTYEGKELPIGAYVYVANALTFEGEEIRETGTVTLIR